MPWKKSGNVSIQLLHDAPGTRSICNNFYSCLDPINIYTLALSGEENGDYKITIQAPTLQAYQYMAAQLLRAKYPFSDRFAQRWSPIVYKTSSFQSIGDFLLTIKTVAPELSEIEQDIYESLGAEIPAETLAPTWHQIGLFSEKIPFSNLPHIRAVTFMTYAPDSIISEFCLLGYSSYNCIFMMTLVEEHAYHLRQALAASGFFEQDNSDEWLCFAPSSVNKFIKLLDILRSYSSHFAEIYDDFKKQTIPLITGSMSQPSNDTFFQRSPGTINTDESNYHLPSPPLLSRY